MDDARAAERLVETLVGTCRDIATGEEGSSRAGERRTAAEGQLWRDGPVVKKKTLHVQSPSRAMSRHSPDDSSRFTRSSVSLFPSEIRQRAIFP